MEVYAHHRRTRGQGRVSPDPANWQELVGVWLKSIEEGVGSLTTDELALLSEYRKVVAYRDHRGSELHDRLVHQRNERDLEHSLRRLRGSRGQGVSRNPTGV